MDSLTHVVSVSYRGPARLFEVDLIPQLPVLMPTTERRRGVPPSHRCQDTSVNETLATGSPPPGTTPAQRASGLPPGPAGRRLGVMDGFNVEALKTAGLSTAELTAVLSETQVEDIDCDGAAVGVAADRG